MCWTVGNLSLSLPLNVTSALFVIVGSLLFMDDKETSIVEKMTLAKDTEQGTCSILENEKWSDLPIDVLMLVTQRLSLVDHLRMTATCKSWQRATRSTWSPQTPFLLFIEDRKAKFFDPLLKKVYVARIPELLDAKFHYSKDAWLLLSRKKLSELFFFNPLTNEKINLPNIELFFNYLTDESINPNDRIFVKKGAFVLSFSSSPTSQDCVVFLILRETWNGSSYDRVTIYTYCHSDRTWKRFRSIPRGSTHDLFEELFEGQLAYNSPVYLDGRLYYLSTKGTLGVFYTNGTTYVGYPTGLCSGKHDCYLVESHGELLSVFCRRNKIHFFQFDLRKWIWIKMKSLEDNLLFLDRLTSLSMTAVGGQKNRIYFSAFKRCCNDPVFFSLQTKKFSREISKCKEHVRRIWVDPKGFELAYGTKSRENPLIVLGKAKDGCN